MIQVNNLTKRFGATLAVDRISFSVDPGEIVGFLGPNGAGKSTTMRMITGFLGADEGDVAIGGAPFGGDPEAARALIGYLPENNPLYEDMMVLEYLDFVGEVRGLTPGERGDRIRKNAGLYGIAEVMTKDIGELSKGYRQRVGLATAALTDPPIMILDEPTSGLDPNQIVEIRRLIREIGKTKTIILSTHNLAEVEAMCSRVLIINKGRIVADDTAANLEQRTHGAVLHARVKAGADPTAVLKSVAGVRDAKRVAGDDGWHVLQIAVDGAGRDPGELIFDAAVKNGWKIAELRGEAASLEQIFAHLTRGEAAK
ncbi:ABC transporter ATP-binding protein [bacterium]|nr:ABC transporter ATP-binding protein [bacterium]